MMNEIILTNSKEAMVLIYNGLRGTFILGKLSGMKHMGGTLSNKVHFVNRTGLQPWGAQHNSTTWDGMTLILP